VVVVQVLTATLISRRYPAHALDRGLILGFSGHFSSFGIEAVLRRSSKRVVSRHGLARWW